MVLNCDTGHGFTWRIESRLKKIKELIKKDNIDSMIIYQMILGALDDVIINHPGADYQEHLVISISEKFYSDLDMNSKYHIARALDDWYRRERIIGSHELSFFCNCEYGKRFYSEWKKRGL